MDQFQSARNIAHVLLSKYGKEELNTEVLELEIDNVFKMNGFDKVDRDDLIVQLEADLNIYSGKATELVEKDVKRIKGKV